MALFFLGVGFLPRVDSGVSWELEGLRIDDKEVYFFFTNPLVCIIIIKKNNPKATG